MIHGYKITLTESRNIDHVRLKILENKFLTGLNCEIQSINGYKITLTESRNFDHVSAKS